MISVILAVVTQAFVLKATRAKEFFFVQPQNSAGLLAVRALQEPVMA
jgi:hypothetical protein